jgi:predicted nucleic acid-binding protein
VLSKARNIIQVSEKEKLRAAKLLTFGIKPFDALHLALAETGKADYFCICDDRLLQNAKKVKDLLAKVVNAINLVQEIEK